MATGEIAHDAVVGALVRFARNARPEKMPAEVVHEAKRRLLDTLGCAVGGYGGEPGQVARRIASSVPAGREGGARVLGLAQHTTPDLAAFANTVMVRYLDFNDSFASAFVSGGHPSDMVMALVAAADSRAVSGTALLRGIICAYQSNASIPVPFKKRGWDQGVMTGIGATCGLIALLGMDDHVAIQALAIAVTMNVPLRVSRSGELSMWKGCATAAAARNAVFAAELADAGMTGPDQPITGRHGLIEQVTDEFELQLDPDRHGYHILRADTKRYPVEGGMQAVLPTVTELVRGIAIEEIERVDVRTYWGLWFEAASEPEKWDPHTRETADHSLPYVMAVALRDGGVTERHFEPAAVGDHSLRPLMAKISVREDPTFTGPDPTLLGPTEITIATVDGRTVTARTGIARGNHRNPMTDDELFEKFLGQMPDDVPRSRAETLAELVWKLDEAGDVRPLIDAWADLRP